MPSWSKRADRGGGGCSGADSGGMGEERGEPALSPYDVIRIMLRVTPQHTIDQGGGG